MTSEKKVKNELLIGAHTSIAGGLDLALYEAQSLGANITQIFTVNQRRWFAKPFEAKQIELWNIAKEKTGIHQVMSHASFLINLAAPNPVILEKSLQGMRQEIHRCKSLQIKWLNFHPGSSVTSSAEEGLERIVQSLLQLEPMTEGECPLLLLEATAGQGSQLGSNFDQLAYIIDRVKNHLPIGVCLDTCHIYVAGYDLQGALGWTRVIEQFDDIVGLKNLHALHVNDSLKGLSSHVDRHAALGEGTIGWKTFEALVTDPRTRHLPMFLETPLGIERWKIEIDHLKKHFQNFVN
jgi:deoxyribonuclease-4